MYNYRIAYTVFIIILNLTGWTHALAIEQTVSKIIHVQHAAEQGNSEAQYELGSMYFSGRNIAQDYSKAVYWYQKSAAQGENRAQYNLGFLYELGYGILQDSTKAVHWYQESAKQGNASAQFRLGKMYFSGRGVQKDYTQAVQWYQKAAEQQYAYYDIGQMYALELGVPQDYSKAAQWFTKAAEQGDVRAYSVLGLMYIAGLGIPTDRKTGCTMLHDLAEWSRMNSQTLAEQMGVSIEKAASKLPIEYRDLHSIFCTTERGDISQSDIEKRLKDLLIKWINDDRF